MSEGGSNWEGSQRWEAGCKRIYLLQNSSQGSPRGRFWGCTRPGTGWGRTRAVSALVVVKGMNTQVPTINALRGLPRLADN